MVMASGHILVGIVRCFIIGWYCNMCKSCEQPLWRSIVISIEGAWAVEESNRLVYQGRCWCWQNHSGWLIEVDEILMSVLEYHRAENCYVAYATFICNCEMRGFHLDLCMSVVVSRGFIRHHIWNEKMFECKLKIFHRDAFVQPVLRPRSSWFGPRLVKIMTLELWNQREGWFFRRCPVRLGVSAHLLWQSFLAWS